MTEPNNQSLTDTQNEKMIESLRYEIADLKFQLNGCRFLEAATML
jgi:hypothetical protein